MHNIKSVALFFQEREVEMFTAKKNIVRQSPFIIYDAIHEVMEFPKWLKPLFQDIVNLPSVQRLRRIKQLALSDLVFPTATHTRFSHSLGTCFLARRILQQLQGDSSLIHEEDEAYLYVLLAAFLHDIGHGPFSHTFEDFFQRRNIKLHHESWTSHILHSYEFLEVFSKHNLPHAPTILSALIAKSLQAPEEAPGSLKGIWTLAIDIISSQLDADRLDYLLRDSHFCGVAYGQYDLNWLINSMTFAKTSDGYRLAITPQAIGTVEHFLVARRLMFRNIYCYPKIIGFESYIVSLLSILTEKEEYFSKIISEPLSTFLLLAKNMDSADSFIEKSVDSFMHLCDDDIWSVTRALATHPKLPSSIRHIQELAQKLYRHETPNILPAASEEEAAMWVERAQETLRLNEEQKWKISSVRLSFELYSSSEEPILVVDPKKGHDSYTPLTEQSEFVGALCNRKEPTHFIACDKQLFEKLTTFL